MEEKIVLGIVIIVAIISVFILFGGMTGAVSIEEKDKICNFIFDIFKKCRAEELPMSFCISPVVDNLIKVYGEKDANEIAAYCKEKGPPQEVLPRIELSFL